MTILKDTKLSGLRGFIDRIRDIGKPKVLVGVPASENRPHDAGGISMAGLAAVHELGIGVPDRSYLRSAILEGRGELTATIAQGTVAYSRQNKKLDANFYNNIGLFGSNLVKAKIAKGPFTPLHPETIKRKGSSLPLVDTGALRQSITWVVR